VLVGWLTGGCVAGGGVGEAGAAVAVAGLLLVTVATTAVGRLVGVVVT